MARCMFRYRVLVNDQPQTFDLGGNPLHVEASRVRMLGNDDQHVVDFWAETEDQGPDGGVPITCSRTFQVFGTGHPLPEGARWWGTTARTPECLVWHLYEIREAP